eukprot:TRINITY_DN5787_c0_g1_i1.p1 TRINITY_DN5787_c0_g1~~TRINITY_DN5787_c0_g1_i1.p1  ORF type:complete len:428 (+),score=75.18 TRINITY_DN5787_c0_g1_i1:3-1286(+)
MYLHIDCRLLFSHVLHICIIFILVLKVYARGSVAFFFFQAEDGIRDLVRSRGLGGMHGFGMGMGLLCDQQARIHGFKDYEEQALKMGWAEFDMRKHSAERAVQMYRNLAAPAHTKFLVTLQNDQPVVTKLGPATPDYLKLCGASVAHMVVTDSSGLPHNDFRVIKRADHFQEGLEAWVKPPLGQGQVPLDPIPCQFSNPNHSEVHCGVTDQEIVATLLELHSQGRLTADGTEYAEFELIEESREKAKQSEEAEKAKNGIQKKETPLGLEYKPVLKKERSLHGVVITFAGSLNEDYPDYHLHLKEYQQRHQEGIEQQLISLDENLARRHTLLLDGALPVPVAPEPNTREFRMQMHVRDLVHESQGGKEPFRLLKRGEKLPKAFEAMMGVEELLYEDDETRKGWTISQRLFAEGSVDDWDLHPDPPTDE